MRILPLCSTSLTTVSTLAAQISQKNTTANYQMVDDKEITIDENSEPEILIELNDVEIEVPNAYIETTFYSDLYSLCQNLVKN